MKILIGYRDDVQYAGSYEIYCLWRLLEFHAILHPDRKRALYVSPPHVDSHATGPTARTPMVGTATLKPRSGTDKITM